MSHVLPCSLQTALTGGGEREEPEREDVLVIR